MTIQFPRPTGTPSIPSLTPNPRLNSGTSPGVPAQVPPLPGTPATLNPPSLLKLKDGINNAGAFNPVQEGVFAQSTDKPARARNNELAQSIQQIIKALESALPPNPPAHLEAAIDKLKALHDRLEGALENASEAQAAGEAAQPEEPQAAEAAQEAQETQETEASQETSEGQESESAQEAEEGQQAEETQEVNEAQETDSASEAAEASSAEESAEEVESADQVTPEEQGLELGPTPEEVKPQNNQDDTYQLLQDQNTQKLLERLMGNQMYTQLLSVLDPRDEKFPLA